MLRMLTDDDFQFFVECIQHEDPEERVFALSRRRDVPSGDPRVLQYLETALEDRTVWKLGLPATYGELRYLAAQALTAERKLQQIDTPVIIEAMPEPLNITQLEALCKANDIDPKGEPVARYRALVRSEKLPLLRYAPAKRSFPAQ